MNYDLYVYLKEAGDSLFYYMGIGAFIGFWVGVIVVAAYLLLRDPEYYENDYAYEEEY